VFALQAAMVSSGASSSTSRPSARSFSASTLAM
jgi:hypothetical protein